MVAHEAQMYFADNLPKEVPSAYWLLVKTSFKPNRERTLELGFSIIGKGKLYINGVQKVDLYTSKPEKTIQTPIFNQLSVEVMCEMEAKEGDEYEIGALLHHEGATHGMGSRSKGGLRIGCRDKIDPDEALKEAVALAKEVDVPIVIAGLNADWESEACDRSNFDLSLGVDALIEGVIRANPNTVVVTQAGTPIAMPWKVQCSTLLHAWFGGMETGHGITDVVFGRTNPSGRLSITFLKRVEDTAAFLSSNPKNKKIFYGDGVFVGHHWHEHLRLPPLFYFGYGLSYTMFEYSNLRAPEKPLSHQRDHI